MFLLRHGATGLNLEKPYRLQGNEVDHPLAPVGVAQSAAARDLLRTVPLRAIYTSPLQRAVQTAAIVAAPHGLAVVPLEALREGSVGRWENRTWDDIRAAEPEAYERFIADPGTHGYAGGENFTQVGSRVHPAINELLRRHRNECFVVVGHQIINRVFLGGLLGLSMADARRMMFANGGISVVTLEHDQPVVVSVNITWPALTPFG
jgi:broad specificity phosphatase PhoE